MAVVAGTALFMQMAHPGHLPRGALIGTALLLLTVGGLLHALGLLRPEPDATPLADSWLGGLPGEPRWLSPLPAAGLGLLLVSVLGAALGMAWLWLPILLALLLLLPAARRRPGLLLLVVASLIQLPTLGAFGLWDPWETHYGEVAREILARDDWISLWWAQDGWFWSKPILIFWVEALSWSASGIDFMPDTAFQYSEWAVRLPHYAMAMLALAAIYHVLSRVFSPRAGLLAGIVLSTTPYYAFLTRQAVTDMPLVANLSIAVMCLLLALVQDEDAPLRGVRIGPFGWSLRTTAVGLLLVILVPQVLYLVSRNVTLVDGYLFAWHPDQFMSGSGFNPDVPGNQAPRPMRPHIRSLHFQPAAQALFWLLGGVLGVALVARERRLRPHYMHLFYLFCGLSFMGKGLPGIALPGLVALMALLTTQRWRLLLGGHLRVGVGILLVTVTSMPWFVAMYMRHGPRFTNRLLIHDHINRLTRGVHGDKGSIQYFIEQLGYGMFPWVALVPLALSACVPGPDDGEPRGQQRRQIAMVVGLWFVSTFVLFSAMTTKFHHYIFPAVPPLAMLVGLQLDRMLGEGPARGRRRMLRIGALAVAPALAVLGVAGLLGDPRGVVPAGVEEAARVDWALLHGWPAWVCGALLLLAIGMVAWALFARGSQDAADDDAIERGETRAAGSAPRLDHVGVGLLLGVAVLAFVGRDLSWDTGKPEGPERLIQLFVYNYTRDFPVHLDYRPILGGFGVVASVLCALMAWPRIRHKLVPSLSGLSLCFAVWLVDVYMFDLTPHWTQGQLIGRYYELRTGPDEPLLAWQMNWKGENYYTGNRVYAFQPLNNKDIKAYIDQHEGQQVYLVLEHKRLKRLRTLLGQREVTAVTTRRDCNKFVLVRAVL